MRKFLRRWLGIEDNKNAIWTLTCENVDLKKEITDLKSEARGLQRNIDYIRNKVKGN